MTTPANQLITQSLFQQAEQVYLLSQIHGAIESRLLSRSACLPCPPAPESNRLFLYRHTVISSVLFDPCAWARNLFLSISVGPSHSFGPPTFARSQAPGGLHRKNTLLHQPNERQQAQLNVLPSMGFTSALLIPSISNYQSL